MAESSEMTQTTQATSSTGLRKFTLICQFYPYTRCNYTKEVNMDDGEKVSNACVRDWKAHVLLHYRDQDPGPDPERDDREPGEMDQILHCWLPASRCPEAKKGSAFGEHLRHDAPDAARYVAYDRMMDHMLDHHFKKPPGLTREDLRDDDHVIIMTACVTKELHIARGLLDRSDPEHADEFERDDRCFRRDEELPERAWGCFKDRMKLIGWNLFEGPPYFECNEEEDEDGGEGIKLRDRKFEKALERFNSKWNTNLTAEEV